MTKKIKLKDKKASPSYYLLSFCLVFMSLVAIYFIDSNTNINNISNKLITNTTSKYQEITSTSYVKELDSKKVCEKKYYFHSSEPIIDEVIFEEPKKAIVVPTVPVDMVTTPDVDYILSAYNLSLEEFYTVVAIVAAEGGGSYTDAYAVANVIYNRTLNTKWTYYANSMGLDGTNLFVQSTLPAQFSVYASGSYLRFMYQTGTNAYNAVVTLLTTRESMHNYMSFRDGRLNIEGVQFIEGGNIYFSSIY